MEIPAIYAVLRGGEVRAAPVRIDGMKITFASEPVRQSHFAEDAEERIPVVVADMKGFGKGKIDDRLLMKLKFPGNDIWFMSHIEDIEDVFDCFMGEIEKLLIPYHTVRRMSVLRETFDISDNCIPVLFAPQGRVKCRGSETKDIRTVLEELEKIGFHEIAVFDSDSVLRPEDWISLRERSEGVIPFIRYRNEELVRAGFKRIIFDH